MPEQFLNPDFGRGLESDLGEIGLPHCNNAERDALVAIFNATNGSEWIESENWVTDEFVGVWFGITTDADGRVVKLELGSNGLQGTIPPEIAALSRLEVLDLGTNGLSGVIPVEIGELGNLTTLILSDNQLIGEITLELGRLGELRTLSLGSNELSGRIPMGLGELRNLERLDLSRNSLSGSLPLELFGYEWLSDLDVSRNQLSGEVPAEIGALTSLGQLDISFNTFSGRLPVELADLALDVLEVSGNEFTGCVSVAIESVFVRNFARHRRRGNAVLQRTGRGIACRVIQRHQWPCVVKE